jgi:hypothetical protein
VTTPSAPVPLTVVRWQCPHCRRTSSKKATTQAHIGRCWHNPGNRGCKTCAYFEPAGGGAECEPGRPCRCNDYPESCAVEAASAENIPTTGCPAWQPTQES